MYCSYVLLLIERILNMQMLGTIFVHNFISSIQGEPGSM